MQFKRCNSGDRYSLGPRAAARQASHQAGLVQRDRIWINLDHAQKGIGTASCGPGLLPQHRLEAVPTTFAVSLSPLGRSRA